MKRVVVSCLLVAVMIAGCGKDKSADQGVTQNTEVVSSTEINAASSEESADKSVISTEVQLVSAEIATSITDPFREEAADKSTSKLVDSIIKNTNVDFELVTQNVEPGYLAGFDSNNKIKGFKKATMFSPASENVPFIGYVFELKEGKDAAEFSSKLSQSANLIWNDGTVADSLIIESVGNKVLFVMYATK